MEVTPTLLDLQSLDLSIDRLRARERTLEGGDEVAARAPGGRRGRERAR